MSDRWLAILGTPDEPTDAVEEYCHYLSDALTKQDIELQLLRVRWAELGWRKALIEITGEIAPLNAKWILLQYTALGWSRRGFPLNVIRLIHALKKSGARCCVVFHDPEPHPGGRWRDRSRRHIQRFVMRTVVRLADINVLTVAKETIDWIPKAARNVVFIPVGANLPNPERAWQLIKNTQLNSMPTIVVYSISGGTLGRVETKRVSDALRTVAREMGSVRLSVLGRNSEIAGKQLEDELAGSRVEIVVHGLRKPEDLVELLGSADVFLFARGPISTRRGSALAAIACGLPVVSCEGWETAAPVIEAGVWLLPENSWNSLGPGLVRVLKDDALRDSLRARSRFAQSEYFSWSRIAAKYAEAFCKMGKDSDG
jgi:glycosyltransferase involved in cell wall biosynthesis